MAKATSGLFGKVLENSSQFSNTEKHFSNISIQTGFEMWSPLLTHFSKNFSQHFPFTFLFISSLSLTVRALGA